MNQEAITSHLGTQERNGAFVVIKTHPAHCGPASKILSEELRQWLRRGVGCVAGRREFMSNRYFAVEVHKPSDVVVGWRHFIDALEQHSAVACLYTIDMPPPPETTESGVRGAILGLAEVMSVLSDTPSTELAAGGRLNLTINTTCPVTGCKTHFFDFDAIAFVPEANDEKDPLYDPLMSAPTPLVNVSSDIYGFSMFTWDYCRSYFDCEVRQLTTRERRYLFSIAANSWQRIAEKTITNYSRSVNQSLCPTHMNSNKNYWTANHQDPAFGELEKRQYVHEMPVQYTPLLSQRYSHKFNWLASFGRFRSSTDNVSN